MPVELGALLGVLQHVLASHLCICAAPVLFPLCKQFEMFVREICGMSAVLCIACDFDCSTPQELPGSG